MLVFEKCSLLINIITLVLQYQAPVGVPGIQNTQVVYTNQQQQPLYSGQHQQQSYAVPYNTQQQPQYQYPG